MKLAGMIFIVASAGSVGLGIARGLRKRCFLFQQLLQALQLLRNEIAFCGTPLPQIFALMAASCRGELETIFSETARSMDHGKTSPSEAMYKALKGCVDRELTGLLLQLAAGLGKYDLEAQLNTVEAVREQVQTLLYSLEQERRTKSKTYETLGICTGLSLAILLV